MTDRDADAAALRLIEWAGRTKLPMGADVLDVCNALIDSRQSHAEYVERHQKCVQEAMDNSMHVHDEIESRRDGIERELAEERQQLAALAQEMARLKVAESEHLDYMSQASTAVREIQDAQRERDAQQLDNAAAELDGTSRVNSNIARILREEAAKMRGAGRAARTPQEPT